MQVLERTATIPFDQATVSAWHERSGAMRRLSPTWQIMKIIKEAHPIRDGARGEFQLAQLGFWIPWTVELEEVRPGVGFVDRQIKGPFHSWRHEHVFEAADGSSCTLHDRVNYALPLGGVGQALMGGRIRRDLDAMFTARHIRLAEDLRRHQEEGPGRSLRIGITGSSGLIGTALDAFLTTGGHEVVRLVRRQPRKGASEVLFNPARGQADMDGLEGFDALVHLAAAGIADKRWSGDRKQVIRNTRVLSTRSLVSTLADLKSPPKVLVSASAIGFYGHREEPVDDSSAPGRGYLPDMCVEWEQAAQGASQLGIRVVSPRIGVVLSPQGGALAKLRTPASLGLAGRVGTGRQGMSTIGLDDLVYMFHRAIADDSVVGPFNAVGPEPVSQMDFARTLGRVLGRPTFLPLPVFAVKLMFGEMGERLLLEGQFVRPTRMQELGFRFSQPTLEETLRLQLGRFASEESSRD